MGGIRIVNILLRLVCYDYLRRIMYEHFGMLKPRCISQLFVMGIFLTRVCHANAVRSTSRAFRMPCLCPLRLCPLRLCPLHLRHLLQSH